MLSRLRQAAAILRPRTLAQMAARLTRLTADHDELAEATRQRTRAVARQLRGVTHEAARDRKAAATATAAQAARLASLTTEVSALQETVQWLTARNAHLTIAMERVASDDARTALVADVLDARAVRAHVQAVVDRSHLEPDPYPHMVLDGLLPQAFYDALIATMPPRGLFDDAVNKEQLRVPPREAGLATYRIWKFLVAEILEGQLQDALLERFRDPLTEYARRFWPSATLDDLGLIGSDGRIILRQRGYRRIEIRSGRG
jgi:hypothetical protein